MSKRLTFFALLLLSSTAVLAGERVSVVLHLESPPAIENYLHAMAAGKNGASALRAAVTAARNQIAVIEAEQQAVVNDVYAVSSTEIIYRMQRLANVIAVDVDASQLDELRKIPGVTSIEPLEVVQRTNVSSVPLIGGPDVWRAAAPLGATGKNIKVGIIDTGLDYIHRDFGGDANYTGKVFTGTTFPTSDKVPGGVDLAGDDFDPGSATAANRVPKPDGDPMDCAGHGSHVAGTIGGYGVKKDNTTYTGPYNVAFDPSIFNIGPGVAPEAKLYPIRVFGCGGSTTLVSPALEWALDPNKDGDFSDHMDVVNMSLGSGFGSSTNSNATAADNLAKAGCIVVASAGNDGDTYYITGSPASSNHAFSVAASVDALEPADALQITAPAALAKSYIAHHAVNFDWFSAGFAAGLTGTVARPATQLSGCSSFPSSDRSILSGKIALLDWTDNDCGSATRVTNALVAGATGVILRYTHEDLDLAIAGSSSIPATLVPKSTGDAILSALSGGPAAGTVTVNFNADQIGALPVITTGNNDLLASFSSRGPRIDDNGFKPEITAPGFTTWSVRAKSGFRGTSLSGTSMAAPHVTGAMALLKQIHPDWTGDNLKALAMSTATHDLFTGQNHTGSRYAVSRIGAGRVDVFNASKHQTLVRQAESEGGPGVIGVSFGAPDVTGVYTKTKPVVVLNQGSGTLTSYRMSYDPAVTQPGVTFSFPASIDVPPNGSATFNLTMTANAATMKHVRDTSLGAQVLSTTRSWLNEASGWLVLTTTGQDPIRLPIFAAPRPASSMRATSSSFPGDSSGNFTMKMTGTTLATGGSTAEDENAVVGAFELSNIGTRSAVLPASLNIKYTGIATDFAAQKAAGKGVAESTIYFAVVTFGSWSTPTATPIRIDIDTNNDGTDDFRVASTDLAQYSSSNNGPSDVFISSVCTEVGANCKFAFRNGVDASVADMVLFNTNVLILPVKAADLGLSSTKTSFTYRIRTGFSSAIDTQPRQTYDVSKPGMSFSATANAPFGFADNAANTITVAYDKANFTNAKSKGILLLHLHNADGSHDEIVTAATSGGRHRAATH